MSAVRSPGRLVQIRPRAHMTYLHENRTVLVTDRDGWISEDENVGLFVRETRVVSRWVWRVKGKPLQSALHSAVEASDWLGYYVVPAWTGRGDETPGKLPEECVEVRVSRFVGDGMREEVELTSYAREPVAFALELQVDADFLDLAEADVGNLLRPPKKEHARGETRRRFHVDGVAELVFDHHAENRFDHQGERGVATFDAHVAIRFEGTPAPPRDAGDRIAIDVALEPRQSLRFRVLVACRVGDLALGAPQRSSFGGVRTERDRLRATFEHHATRFSAPASETSTHDVIETLEQSKHDLVSLRLFDLDHGERAWTPAAGVPSYLTLFGRDALTAAWAAALVSQDPLRGVLQELPRWQRDTVDPWRSQEPGRMLHQASVGPRALLNEVPYARFYASNTTSSFYPAALVELWYWTGDDLEIVEPLVEPALRALAWLDRYADVDGDGFYEYFRRSEKDLKNQGWKDSDRAIVHADGSVACDPIATCEEQGFVYFSKLRMAELLVFLGREAEAARLAREAYELKQRFDEVFWMEDEGTYALALDGKKQLVRTIASNAGHCLGTAIADRSRALRVADRLFARDMFSGWGIRTLSTENPAYNPFAYQRGTVWPAEQGILALALDRYGLRSHVELVCRAQFEAARLFESHRLPECFGGQPRDAEHPFPAGYVRADCPQAWSAAAPFLLLQSMLSLHPFAPLGLLVVDPTLPPWLPEITLHDLHVGRSVVSIRFFRRAAGDTDYEVLDLRGKLRVVRQPSPWSLTAHAPERLRDLLMSIAR